MNKLRRIFSNRLALQLLLTGTAAISLAVLSAFQITEARRNAESVVVRDAGQALRSALRELRQQGDYRTRLDSQWGNLPVQARNVSLAGVTSTVLRAFDGMEGGFRLGSQMLGYSYPTHDTGGAKTDMPSAERPLIEQVIDDALRQQKFQERVIRGRANLLIIASLPFPGTRDAVWAMKRVPIRTDGARQSLLAALIAASLLCVAGSFLTGISLVRGVRQIQQGLSKLETNFAFRLRQRRDEFGNIIRAINRMADARDRLEEELRREDRLRALGRMAAGLAHEIRNPLNSIGLTLQVMEARLQKGTLQKGDLQTVRRELDRLNILLSELLHLQQAREPERKQQLLRPVLMHCVDLVSAQASMQNIHLNLIADENVQAVFDQRHLTQAVVNLLLNSLQVSSNGQAITLRADLDRTRVRVLVQDEGPGLSETALEHLFEPLFTTKPEGTGLGLAVSRELMRSQHGDLKYVSNGRGACFAIELPKD